MFKSCWLYAFAPTAIKFPNLSGFPDSSEKTGKPHQKLGNPHTDPMTFRSPNFCFLPDFTPNLLRISTNPRFRNSTRKRNRQPSTQTRADTLHERAAALRLRPFLADRRRLWLFAARLFDRRRGRHHSSALREHATPRLCGTILRRRRRFHCVVRHRKVDGEGCEAGAGVRLDRPRSGNFVSGIRSRTLIEDFLQGGSSCRSVDDIRVVRSVVQRQRRQPAFDVRLTTKIWQLLFYD